MGYHDITAGLQASQALKDAASRAGLEPAQAGAILEGLFDYAAQGRGAEGALEGIAEKAALQPAQVRQFLPMVLGLLQTAPQEAVNIEAAAETDASPAAPQASPEVELLAPIGGRRNSRGRRLFGRRSD